jgi:hypothetical protein
MRYQMDGSYESYCRLMRDVNAGVSEAREALLWYKQYQKLSKDVRVRQLPPPPARSYTTTTDVVVIDGNWVLTGQPTEAQLRDLQYALERIFPKPSPSCPSCGTPASTGCPACLAAGRAKIEIVQAQPPAKPPYSPPGVTIASHQRIGDDVRDAYLNHLGAMFSGGNISQEEYEARSDAAVTAKTKQELEFLTQDLPELSPKGVKKGPSPGFFGSAAWSARVFYATFGILNAVDAFTAGSSVFVIVFLAVLSAACGIMLAATFVKGRKKITNR